MCKVTWWEEHIRDSLGPEKALHQHWRDGLARKGTGCTSPSLPLERTYSIKLSPDLHVCCGRCALHHTHRHNKIFRKVQHQRQSLFASLCTHTGSSSLLSANTDHSLIALSTEKQKGSRFVLYIFFWDRASCNPGWPPSYHVVKANPKLLIFPPCTIMCRWTVYF